MSPRTQTPLPALLTDEEAERFVDEADLSEFDLSAFKPMRFEFAPKDGRVNMRLPRDLLAAVKMQAQRRHWPYQRNIRDPLEQAVADHGAAQQLG